MVIILKGQLHKIKTEHNSVDFYCTCANIVVHAAISRQQTFLNMSKKEGSFWK